MTPTLLEALQAYEEGLEPYDMVYIQVYSDGSGRVCTTTAGDIYHFMSIDDAINFLTGNGAA